MCNSHWNSVCEIFPEKPQNAKLQQGGIIIKDIRITRNAAIIGLLVFFSVAASDNSFELDYGEVIVTVEMDDWDWYKEGKGIIEGDEVTVYGAVDNDTYEMTTIEASSVYVEDLNAYFLCEPCR
ncbi:MAG: hypothetical protein ACLFQK_06125 [Fibrobacterota bacterium]